VLNVPTVELARKVVACGNASGEATDKFAEFGLTPVAGTVVKAPLIAECFASLECQVRNCQLVAEYNFFVLEVVRAWVKPSRRLPATLHHHGEGLFTTPGRKLRLPSPKTSLRGD
jgi:flavin reductase (DIM6/NTAB) family NADH-FMN oxidoreductase RutF